MSDVTLEQILAAIAESRAEAREGVHALRAEFGDLRAEFGGLRAEFGGLRAEFGIFRTDVLAKIAALEVQFIQTRTGIMDRIDRRQDRLTTVEAELARTRADIMARIDQMQETMTAQGEDDVVQMGAVERAERLIKTTRDDIGTLGEQIMALSRQIRALTMRVGHLEERSGAA